MMQHKRQTVISDAIDTASDKAKDAVDSAAEMVISAADKAKDMAAIAREMIRDMASETGQKAIQTKDKMLEFKTAAAEKASSVVRGAGHEVTDLIRRYPIQSLLVGLAVGFLVARKTVRH